MLNNFTIDSTHLTKFCHMKDSSFNTIELQIQNQKAYR
jgi:hypothetical protein